MPEDPQTVAKLDQVVDLVNKLAAAVYVIRTALEQRGVFAQGEFPRLVAQAEAQLQGRGGGTRPQSNAPANSQPLGGGGEEGGAPPVNLRAA
jgi:hypothetical protein